MRQELPAEAALTLALEMQADDTVQEARHAGSMDQEKEQAAMGIPVNSGIVTAAAAIGGSLVGAAGSVVGTWITARNATRRDLVEKQIAQREALYSDFIAESARLLVDALQHNNNDLETLLPIYALLGRIRLSSSKPVLHRAEEMIQTIMATYPEPNMTAEQIEARALKGRDPLGQFSDICRTELNSLQKQL
jgi:hypothetical protein